MFRLANRSPSELEQRVRSGWRMMDKEGVEPGVGEEEEGMGVCGEEEEMEERADWLLLLAIGFKGIAGFGRGKVFLKPLVLTACRHGMVSYVSSG